MSDLRSLAAGVVATGFAGTKMPRDVAAMLADTPFAGFILFGRNVTSLAQVRELTDAMRAWYPADRPPVIAIDQEGGRVARIRAGTEEIPSMMALAATGDVDLADRAGEQMAFDLRRAGVNVDYAPVVDLALERMNTVIGTRSFGNDPLRVSAFAAAFASGMQRGGVVPTIKHFPGYGSSAVDAHRDLPTIDLDEATLRARDLIPFVRTLGGVPAVMTAHIVISALDPLHPATLSPRILTGLLRNELGFEGACFTDCMEMDAIAHSVGTRAGAVQTIAAGADCVLISHNATLAAGAVDDIVRAVEDGTIPRSRLEEAYARMTRLRASLCAPLALDAASPHAGVGVEIGRRAVTLLRGSIAGVADGDVVVSFEGTTTEGVQGTHAEHTSLRAYVPELAELRVPLDPVDADVADALERVAQTKRRPVVLMRRAHVYAKQAEAIARVLRAHPDAVLISVREPFDVTHFPEASTLLCTYGDDAPSIAGLATVLYGGAAPTGSLPLEIAAVA